MADRHLTDRTITLSGIHVYPVKSLRGIALEESPVEPRGLRGDRRWMVTDAEYEFLTQREVPELALVEVRQFEDGLRIAGPGMESLTVARPDASRRNVRIFKDVVPAVPAGGEADDWFSRYLGFTCHLVYMDDTGVRPVDPRYASDGDIVSFADGFPLLLLSCASLDDLNSRLRDPLPMNRFRPNLVLSGAEPFEEDTWHRIRIGQVVMDVAKPCARCAITTVDQNTAERGDEPLRTLATFRKSDGKVYFGQNLIPRSRAVVRVGDEVEILVVAP